MVVVDPVAFGATPFRTETIAAFLAATPVDCIKGNAAEVCVSYHGRGTVM